MTINKNTIETVANNDKEKREKPMRMNEKALYANILKTRVLEAEYELLLEEQLKTLSFYVTTPELKVVQSTIGDLNKPLFERLYTAGQITDAVLRKKFPDYSELLKARSAMPELHALRGFYQSSIYRVRIDFERQLGKGLGLLHYTHAMNPSSKYCTLPLELLTYSNWEVAAWTRKLIADYKERKANEEIEYLAQELAAKLKARKRKTRLREARVLKKNKLYSREGEIIETAV